MTITEDDLEQLALTWLQDLGYTCVYGPDIAPGEPTAERDSYHAVVLEGSLRDALTRLNPTIPADALEDALRKVLHPQSPSLVQNNRTFHQMLVNGVTVEYARADGSIAGDQARLLDFDSPTANDWLAVAQYTIIEGQHTRRGKAIY